LLDVMQEVKAQGLVKFISISSTLPFLDEYIKWGTFDTFQIPYSVLEPEHHDVITRAAEAGMGIIIRGGIAKGGPESDVARKERVDLWEAAKLAEILPEGMSSAELILRCTLTHPHCDTTIVGTLNPDHLAENVAAAKRGPIPADLYDEIARRVKEATACSPGWHTPVSPSRIWTKLWASTATDSASRRPSTSSTRMGTASASISTSASAPS